MTFPLDLEPDKQRRSEKYETERKDLALRGGGGAKTT